MQSEKHLHIISFNTPYPPSYGGIIDVYFKLLALYENGVKVHLHVFYSGKKPVISSLDNICFEVKYYTRKRLVNPFRNKMPLMVQSRHSWLLYEALLKDEYPIFFEGLHCTYLLDHPAFKDRIKIVRMHNIEHLYYKNLAAVEPRFIKRIYLKFEAKRLKNYEEILHHATKTASISPADHKIIDQGFHNSFYLPVFQPNNEILSKIGKGDYVLYHGNLGVAENNEAALFLVNEVFNELDLPFIIAGANPSKGLRKAISGKPHIQLRSDINTGQIYDLVQNAQINIMPTFQDTGIKLKLVNSLFMGRHCIVNSKMVNETGLESLCRIADQPQQLRSLVVQYFNEEFTQAEITQREKILMSLFDNRQNAALLTEVVFG